MSTAWSLPLPFLFFEKEQKDMPSGQISIELDEVTHRRKVLVCASCTSPITDETTRIMMRGSHEHRFFNSYGIVYGIGCFSQAEGCVDVGDSSQEFTWFPGYLWRVACCRRCQSHLGWHFFGAEKDHFHGLILDRLAEGEEDSGD